MKHLERKMEQIYEDVFYVTLSNVHDSDTAQDITHNVMERILLHAEQLRSDETFKQWALKITRNEINLYFRSIKRYHERVVPFEGHCLESIESQAAIQKSVERDIAQALVTEEDKATLMKALKLLDEKYRRVVHLNVFCEYSLVEVSEILQLNVNTVRSHYIRGIAKLREIFEKLEKGENNG